VLLLLLLLVPPVAFCTRRLDLALDLALGLARLPGELTGANGALGLLSGSRGLGCGDTCAEKLA
jgi:hypothetical protein